LGPSIRISLMSGGSSWRSKLSTHTPTNLTSFNHCCVAVAQRPHHERAYRFAEGPHFTNFIPKTVCRACRPALSSVTTHRTSSPAISERRTLILSTRRMAHRRFCTIRDVWHGAPGRTEKCPSTPASISSLCATARSRRSMSTWTRRRNSTRETYSRLLFSSSCRVARSD